MDNNGHFWWRSAKNQELCFSGRAPRGKRDWDKSPVCQISAWNNLNSELWTIPVGVYPPRMLHTFAFRALRSSNQHSSDRERQNEGRFTPTLNNSQEKGLRIFNKPSFYEARLTFFLDSVEYYKLSGVHLRTFYSEQRHGLSTFYII